jgi:hypothetical protein
MSRYDDLSHLNDEHFRRLTGVQRFTFDKMVEILTEAHIKKKSKGGRPNKLAVSDMLLMALEYLREYRTYYHIGTSYGLSEGTAYKVVKWVENTLIRSGIFSLPGKKELLKSDSNIEIILIDATESPIQRPKKAASILFREEEKTYIKVAGCRR